jgi:hypothetical protein
MYRGLVHLIIIGVDGIAKIPPELVVGGIRMVRRPYRRIVDSNPRYIKRVDNSAILTSWADDPRCIPRKVLVNSKYKSVSGRMFESAFAPDRYATITF